MNMKNLLEKNITQKILIVAICCLVAVISIFVVGKKATSPEFYTKTIQSIEEKKATVMGVTTMTAVASTTLAAVPGDATTPIANEIMNMSSYLLIVVCALVLEKSLLTVFGYLAFKILIPVACALFAISIFMKRSLLKVLAIKFVTFAMVLAVIIPFSFKISDLIYEVNVDTVEDLYTKVEGMDAEEVEAEEVDKSWWDKLVDKVEEGTTKVTEGAKQLVNNFIDVIAIFIITYCAIPIIVFMVVIWFVKFLFNITIPIPTKESLPILRKKENKPELGIHKEEE